MELLEGDFYYSAEHDVAVMKLSAEQANLLRKYVPLSAERIGGPADITTSQYVTLVGFPETKNRKIYQQNKIRGLRYSVGGMVKEATLVKIRVSFNIKRNIDAKTRERVRAPDPHGMSGGAMFGATVNSAVIEGKPIPKLIGIMTDWLDSANEIFGPSMAIPLAIVREAWAVKLPAHLQFETVRIRPQTVSA